eukprot:4460145-Amphidinium_carterae.1
MQSSEEAKLTNTAPVSGSFELRVVWLPSNMSEKAKENKSTESAAHRLVKTFLNTLVALAFVVGLASLLAMESAEITIALKGPFVQLNWQRLGYSFPSGKHKPAFQI